MTVYSSLVKKSLLTTIYYTSYWKSAHKIIDHAREYWMRNSSTNVR